MQYFEAALPMKARASAPGRSSPLGAFVATIKARIFIAFFVMSAPSLIPAVIRHRHRLKRHWHWIAFAAAFFVFAIFIRLFS